MSELAVKEERQLSEVALRKKEAWGNLGIVVHESELQLQARAQELILKISQPASIEDVPEAEVLLKELKTGQKGIQNDRMELTGRLDKVIGRLMDPEKSLNEPIANLANSIIAIKKEYEKIQQIKIAKAEEARHIIEIIKTTLSEKDFEFRSDISRKVTVAFEHALDKGIKPEEIDDYRIRCMKKVGLLMFDIEKPAFRPKHILPEEMEQILQEHWTTNPDAYLHIMTSEMEKKFFDYANAFQNKEEALKQAREEHDRNEAELQDKMRNEKTAAALEASASPVLETAPEVRALKKSFVVDMPENLDNALMIMAAFAANRKACEQELRVAKWFAFTPAQAAVALSKVKSKDNAFQASGIIFKEVSKL